MDLIGLYIIKQRNRPKTFYIYKHVNGNNNYRIVFGKIHIRVSQKFWNILLGANLRYAHYVTEAVQAVLGSSCCW